MKKYRVGLVGIGAVGTEMIKILRQRNFPASEIRVLATRERDEEIADEVFHVHETKPSEFEGLDIVLFAGTEGAKGASKQFAWEAVQRGAIVIDNSDDFRADPRVPLVIPEINGAALEQHQGLIANPNCSTIITLMGIAPLHQAVPLRHLTAVTFQSVSGSGRVAVDELDRQLRDFVAGSPIVPQAYPHQIALNALPQIGNLKPEMPGFTSEEAKLTFESRKILNAPDFQVSATCVRIPTFYSHAVALHAQFSAPLTPERARAILAQAPGVVVLDDPAEHLYPMPLNISGGDTVGVGRIRADHSLEHGLALWCCGDNIRKGAAQNAVQIAEEMIKRHLI